mmetsp:Transcript_24345/g.69152  ORF Transcript_24345/g.69152 Transcript_24345/m.69152 type:complete len:116 (-) Transcript_24345:544-891(-)
MQHLEVKAHAEIAIPTLHHACMQDSGDSSLETSGLHSHACSRSGDNIQGEARSSRKSRACGWECQICAMPVEGKGNIVPAMAPRMPAKNIVWVASGQGREEASSMLGPDLSMQTD